MTVVMPITTKYFVTSGYDSESIASEAYPDARGDHLDSASVFTESSSSLALVSTVVVAIITAFFFCYISPYHTFTVLLAHQVLEPKCL